jgi:hypothetical protein
LVIQVIQTEVGGQQWNWKEVVRVWL